MAVLPTGTVAFMFMGIEGSTRLWEGASSAMQSALARHDDILHSAFDDNRGHVFAIIGDAFCAAFADASNALDAALASQRAPPGMR